MKRLVPIVPNSVYLANDKRIGFDGWFNPEQDYRWSDGKSVDVLFISNDEVNNLLEGRVRIEFSTHGKQLIVLIINNEIFFQGKFSGSSVIEVNFPVKNLRVGENKFTIMLPKAHSPETKDHRILGMRLYALTIK